MVQIPYANSNGSLSVTVQLQNAADVHLVDSSNYQKYKSGHPYRYVGGHYKTTPVSISVHGAGRWYLIVIGDGRYNYQFS